MDEDSFLDLDDDEEEGEGWLSSYSDLITDLMAIFVLLFAFATMMAAGSINQNSLMDLGGGAGVFSSGLEDLTGMGAVSSNIEQQQDFTETMIDELVQALSNHIEESGLSGSLIVRKTGDNVALLRISDSVLFDPGRADIKSEAHPLLSDISEILDNYSDLIQMIRIEGHTDTRPMNTPKYANNWELSTGRATSTLVYLLGVSELSPTRFSASGLGEFHPVADNETPEGMAQNRRVDFIIEAVPVEE